VADNTDGANVAAANATTGTEPAATTPTSATVDTSGNKGAEGRIHGLTAERDRHRDSAAEWERKFTELKQETATEEEKRIEQLVKDRVDTEYGPKLQRLNDYEAELSKKRDALVELIPEEHRVIVDPTASVLKQMQQAESVLALTNQEKQPVPTGGGGNPQPKPNTDRIAHSDIVEWGKDMKVWAEHQADVLKAKAEGRIDWDK
jgi:hypothetical protein